MSLDRRICALERAKDSSAPMVLLLPRDARTATVGGVCIDRADDESEADFVARLRARRGSPVIIVAGSAEDRL